MLFALSAAAVTGFFALAVAVVGAVSLIGVAYISRDNKAQSSAVNQSVSDFERAYLALQAERESDRDRITVLERREDDCLEALTDALNRIAVLEARSGTAPGE